MKGNTKKRKWDRRWEPYLLLSPALLIVLVVMGYPLLYSVRLSFLNYNLMRPKDIYFTGFSNYARIFQDPEIPKVMWNSVKWVVIVVSAQFLLGLVLALLLNSKFRFKGVYQSVVFLPWSPARGRSTTRPMEGKLWYGIPFFGIMILAALQSISTDVIESARIDGASSTGIFFRIMLPYIKPTILTTLLLRVIWVFNSSDMLYVMTDGGPAYSSSTLPLYVFNQAFASLDFGYGSAVGIFIMLLLTVYALIYLKVTKYHEAGDF